MIQQSIAARGTPALGLLLVVLALIGGGASSTRGLRHSPAVDGVSVPAAFHEPSTRPSRLATPSGERKYAPQIVVGQVVWLEDGLKRQFHVSTEPDTAKTAVALATSDGTLLPILPDVRGWAFMLDERLRDTDFEMRVLRHDGFPYLQVVNLYVRKPDGLYEVDYWCDICAIPMFFLQECECCHGPIRIRESLVGGPDTKLTP